jgi:hypothetical protein
LRPKSKQTDIMLDFAKFQAAFPTDGAGPYGANNVKAIETFRKTFDGVLFIDRVLKTLGLPEGWSPFLNSAAQLHTASH